MREWRGVKFDTEPTVWNFLTLRWDDRFTHSPEPWLFVPGLWIAPTRLTATQYKGALNNATPGAVDRLGLAIQADRSEPLGLQLRRALGDPQRKAVVLERIFRDVITTRDLEITTDLYYCPNLQHMSEGLHGGFELAEQALNKVQELRQQGNQPGYPQAIMALLLAAVLDMSGDPDVESE